MKKIDTIELTLSQLGYERADATIGYHITLSKTISTFRHYLSPKNLYQRIFPEELDSSPTKEGVLTTKHIYSNDAFLTHSSQYGEADTNVEMPYRTREGLTRFLKEDISQYIKDLEGSPVRRSWLVRLIFGKQSPENFYRSISNHELFSAEEGHVKVLAMYLARSLSMVGGDYAAVKRFAILMEKANFENPESLAVIALDTNDKGLKTFLNFIQANEELGIEIRDYKAAYNAYSLVDKSGFED